MSERPLRPIVMAGATRTAVRATLDPEERLGRLSELVRTLYITSFRELPGRHNYGRREMPQWDGGEDSHGRRHKPVWPRIAATIMQIGADPFLYMKAQFADKADRPPRPNALHGQAAIDAYELYKQERTERIEEVIVRQVTALEGTVRLCLSNSYDRNRAYRYALCDKTTTTASDLVRYLLAYDQGFMDLATQLFESALLEYVFQKQAFDAVLGNKVPQPLWQAAEELRSAASGV